MNTYKNKRTVNTSSQPNRFRPQAILPARCADRPLRFG